MNTSSSVFNEQLFEGKNAFIAEGTSGINLGIARRLTGLGARVVVTGRNAEYPLTGRFMDADRARELDPFSRIVEQDTLEAEGRALVEEMLRATPLGLPLSKGALDQAIDAPSLNGVIAMGNRSQLLAARDSNFQEGIVAFPEKRTPNSSMVLLPDGLD